MWSVTKLGAWESGDPKGQKKAKCVQPGLAAPGKSGFCIKSPSAPATYWSNVVATKQVSEYQSSEVFA